jgi:hypothetical protein
VVRKHDGERAERLRQTALKVTSQNQSGFDFERHGFSNHWIASLNSEDVYGFALLLLPLTLTSMLVSGWLTPH